MENEIIGPVLPSWLKGKQKTKDIKSPDSDEDLSNSSSAKDDGEENEEIIGPVLPPGFKPDIDQHKDEDHGEKQQQQQPEMLYGPSLPPRFKKSDESIEADLGSKVIGPTLPPGFPLPRSSSSTDDESDSDGEIIGPMPLMGDSNELARIQREFIKRSEHMKKKLNGEVEPEDLKRDSWMTELPAELGKKFGLGPRSFNRRNPMPTGDRSVWTDTPADKAKREQECLEKKESPSSSSSEPPIQRSVRDIELAKEVERYNKSKRVDSLLNIHQKNIKRKKMEDGNNPEERRPFDREVDLQANRFDDAQRAAILKKSRQLNDRFSAGSQQFL